MLLFVANTFIFLIVWYEVVYTAQLSDGSVRLRGPNNESARGRVEIFHNGKWGTVCDDDWDIADAHVVCRQLGYGGATAALGGSKVPDGTGQIWLDDVECKGYEQFLANCSHAGWGDENCNHGEDAGVQCLYIDECATGSNNCEGDANCTDTRASFHCSCKREYPGDTEITCQGWPEGTYGLPKAITGCPKTGGLRWSDGWIELDMEDDLPKLSKFSSNFQMDANLVYGGNINRSFCVKTNVVDHAQAWPKGSYCIYKASNKDNLCPLGMREGRITWDEEDTNYKFLPHSGTLPLYKSDRRWDRKIFYYCCQTTGSWNNSIELPITEPFYLLPYASAKCQRVKWTVSSLEYITYDTENNNNGDVFVNPHAFSNEVNSLPTIYYCHYKACRFKLDKVRGFFSSPKSSSSFPQDFEQCSWHIKAVPDRPVSVIFHNITVSDCTQGSIDIYNGVDQNAPLLVTLCGQNATPAIEVTTSPNKDMFVVLTSSIETTVGFDAEYQPYVTPTPSMAPATSPRTIDGRTRETEVTGTSTTTESEAGRPGSRSDSKGSSSMSRALAIALPIVAGILIICAVILFLFYRRRLSKKKADREDTKEVSNATYGQRINLGMQDLHGDGIPVQEHGVSGTTLSLTKNNPVYEAGEESGYMANQEPVYCSADNPTYEYTNRSDNTESSSYYSSPSSTLPKELSDSGPHQSRDNCQDQEECEFSNITNSMNLYNEQLNNKVSSSSCSAKSTPRNSPQDQGDAQDEQQYESFNVTSVADNEILYENPSEIVTSHFSSPTLRLSQQLRDQSQDDDANIYQAVS